MSRNKMGRKFIFKPKAKLEHYMIEKTMAVYGKTEIHLYLLGDIWDMLGDSCARDALRGLKDNVECDFINDTNTCPQCVLYKCVECPYGARHGYRCGKGSRYKKITRFRSLSNIIGNINLERLIRYL